MMVAIRRDAEEITSLSTIAASTKETPTCLRKGIDLSNFRVERIHLAVNPSRYLAQKPTSWQIPMNRGVKLWAQTIGEDRRALLVGR